MSRRAMPVFPAALAAAAIGVSAVLAAWVLTSEGEPAAAPEPVALFTSLPIYWAEAGDVAGLLDGNSPPHWARTALERSWRLLPLDVLEGEGALAGQRRLLMIQPRPLAPAENVALDDWLTAGGRLLLFADPLLTAESAFSFGDRRRPQDVVLLSPILSRWGLELRFDPEQPPARRVTLHRGASLPVRLAGSFDLRSPGKARRCQFSAQAIVVNCRIGRGRLVAVADAALFEQGSGPTDEDDRRRALDALTATAFSD